LVEYRFFQYDQRSACASHCSRMSTTVIYHDVLANQDQDHGRGSTTSETGDAIDVPELARTAGSYFIWP
ncbi:MAG TPA: hypothetical protein VKZ91_09125, partial [Woeseiaceae bacterium]|nr:hypothetical protein [Woeseiaceae bacterium]